MAKVYALSVGINAYPRPGDQLQGCLNDVDHFQAFLTKRFGEGLQPSILKDGQATREAVIAEFRRHLTAQAGPGDVAVFHYCGHGARSAAAVEFREFFNDGWDEGLVCFDSRDPGGRDLADKELAVLIAELAAKGAHVAIVLDCCHSGSGTRDADSFAGMKIRNIAGLADVRPLESYIGGHYAD